MKQVVVIGAGKIGGAIGSMLAQTGDYAVLVTDRSAEQLEKIERHPAVTTAVVDITDREGLLACLGGKFAVLSAAPFSLTGRIAETARSAGIHYLDLTEDVGTTKKVEELAKGADVAFIPSAAWRRVLFPSSPTTSRRDSTGSTACACVSARYRSIRPTR